MIKTYRRHNLTRCEYEGRNEVVCCKDEDIIEDDNKENGIKLQPLTRQSELPNAQFAIAGINCGIKIIWLGRKVIGKNTMTLRLHTK